VVPMFAGYDHDRDIGRIFGYDITGGRHEEISYFTVGSGSLFARGSLKKLYRDDLVAEDAVRVCLQALYDAADDDSATGGPDMARRIFPIVWVVTADGARKLTEDEISALADQVVNARLQRPDGPVAELPGETGEGATS